MFEQAGWRACLQPGSGGHGGSWWGSSTRLECSPAPEEVRQPVLKVLQMLQTQCGVVWNPRFVLKHFHKSGASIASVSCPVGPVWDLRPGRDQLPGGVRHGKVTGTRSLLPLQTSFWPLSSP